VKAPFLLIIHATEATGHLCTSSGSRKISKTSKKIDHVKLHEPFPISRFLSPRHWPTWLVLGLMWLVAKLPFPFQMRIGQFMGWVLWVIPLKNRKTAHINLRLCFPELNEKARKKLLRQHIDSLGKSMVEIAMAWWSSDAHLAHLAKVDGLEHAQKALEKGKGIILLSAHFTHLEIGGRLLHPYLPIDVVYRHMTNPLFDLVMRRARERLFHKALHRDDIRGLLRSLKDRAPVWYAPDQNYRGKGSVFVNFFNIPAASNSATSRIAKMSGAPVVPFFQYRLPGNEGYQLEILPELENFPSDDPVQDTQRISDIIEKQIRKNPEQYLWVQRRFRDRPSGENYLYSDRYFIFP